MPRIEELRTALLQRAEDWRKTLRCDPEMARVLLRRLIGPLVLHDESTMPDFIKADAEVQTGLLGGLAPHSGVVVQGNHSYNRDTSPAGTDDEWIVLDAWLCHSTQTVHIAHNAYNAHR